MDDIQEREDAILHALMYTANRLKHDTRLYLSGPVTGKRDDNRVAFRKAQQVLTPAGYGVVNPLDLGTSTHWNACMRVDLAVMMTCDAVATLSGWRSSRGASAEVHLARQLGMPVKPWQEWALKPQSGSASDRFAAGQWVREMWLHADARCGYVKRPPLTSRLQKVRVTWAGTWHADGTFSQAPTGGRDFAQPPALMRHMTQEEVDIARDVLGLKQERVAP